jgi:hypothetical protein
MKTFMELDHTNLVQILSFESRFISKLLDDAINSDNLTFEYPLFYKMQHTTKKITKILTPIEVAVENNQIIALNKIIEYVVKYQNTYAFSFLFEKYMLKLLEKGIKVSTLFESEIFCH